MTSAKRASTCLTYGQCGQRKATTRAGAPTASSVDQVVASGPERVKAGSSAPSGSIVDGVATMGSSGWQWVDGKPTAAVERAPTVPL